MATPASAIELFLLTVASPALGVAAQDPIREPVFRTSPSKNNKKAQQQKPQQQKKAKRRQRSSGDDDDDDVVEISSSSSSSSGSDEAEDEEPEVKFTRKSLDWAAEQLGAMRMIAESRAVSFSKNSQALFNGKDDDDDSSEAASSSSEDDSGDDSSTSNNHKKSTVGKLLDKIPLPLLANIVNNTDTLRTHSALWDISCPTQDKANGTSHAVPLEMQCWIDALNWWLWTPMGTQRARQDDDGDEDGDDVGSDEDEEEERNLKRAIRLSLIEASGSTKKAKKQQQEQDVDANAEDVDFDEDNDEELLALLSESSNVDKKRDPLRTRSGKILFFLGAPFETLRRATEQQCVDAVIGGIFCVVDKQNSKSVLLPRQEAIEIDDDDD